MTKGLYAIGYFIAFVVGGATILIIAYSLVEKKHILVDKIGKLLTNMIGIGFTVMVSLFLGYFGFLEILVFSLIPLAYLVYFLYV